LKGRRLLVVQGHPASRELILHYLALWGASVEGCANLEEGIAMLDSRPRWDAVLLDEGALGDTTTGLPEFLYPRLVEREVALAFLVWRDAAAGRLSRLPPKARIMRKPLRPAQLWEDIGALFSPGSQAQPRVSATADAQGENEPSLWVMVADDNEVNLKVVTAYLHLLGCRTMAARNGLEVLELAGRQSFDLVLMDVQMPEMDGLEASRELARRLSPADMPLIIGLSAGVSQTEREVCFEAGMVDFLPKPLRLSDLKAGLERWREWLGEGLGRGGAADGESQGDVQTPRV
jgi:CheY-like chemotaxis protein